MAEVKPVRAEFSLRRFFTHRNLILGLGAFLLGLSLLFVYLGFRPEQRWSMIGMTAAIGGSGLLFLGYCLLLYLKRVEFAEADAAALSWRQGGREARKPWQEVESVYRKEVYKRGRADDAAEKDRWGELRIEFTDRSRLVLDRCLENYDRLGLAVQEAAADAARPRKEAQLAEGGAEFGPVKLTRDGVLHRGKTLRWAEHNYSVASGHLFFAPAQGDFRERDNVKIPLSTIPDYALLLEMMARVGKPISPVKMMYPPKYRHMVPDEGV
jgi:hypothetical protein